MISSRLYTSYWSSLCRERPSWLWHDVMLDPSIVTMHGGQLTPLQVRGSTGQDSNNRNTVILINSHSKIHVIFTSNAEWLLFRMTVMEMTQLDHTVSKTIYIIVGGGEAAANSKICIVFDTAWSSCVFSITVILNNSHSAVDVKITWILEWLLIRITVFLLFEKWISNL